MVPAEPRPDNGAPDSETRIRDWVEFFQLFDQQEALQPHHNVEVLGVFSERDMESRGELIYYISTIGSFSLIYGPELYDQGTIAKATLEPSNGFRDIFPKKELYNSRFNLENYENGQYQSVFDSRNYLNAPVEEPGSANFSVRFDDIDALCTADFPVDYDESRTISSIRSGIALLKSMMATACFQIC